jgi:hypothetical protein
VRRRRSDGRSAETALVEEISGRAVRLRVRHSVHAGEVVFALVYLAAVRGERGPRIALRGRVVRVDERAGGSRAAVVVLTRHRWLFALTLGE